MKNSMSIFLFFAVLFGSCEGDILPPQQSQMVVEGWIEDGGHPVVMLSSTVPVSEEETAIDSLGQFIIRWGRVAVSDGEKTVVLSGKYTKDYIPPYIYSSTAIRGEAGKTYTLTIDYHGQHVTASTTIPTSVPLDSVYSKVLDDGIGSVYTVRAVFHHDAMQQRYFKIFTHIYGQSLPYFSSSMGLFDCSLLYNPADVLVTSGMSIANFGDYKASFEKGDIVSVKLCTMDEVSYGYWYDWAEMENFKSNPLMPVASNPVSNVKGALGYWCGYGSSVKTILVE